MRIAVFFTLFVGVVVSAFSAPEYPNMGPDIFDPHEKAEKLIDVAVTKATREHKRVLLLFGANWCPWCRRLHRALDSNRVTGLLKKNFVLVLVDANSRNDKDRNSGVIERYGNPLQYGLPVFVVLDSKGKQLTTKETASLAANTDAEEAERVVVFLDQWAR